MRPIHTPLIALCLIAIVPHAHAQNSAPETLQVYSRETIVDVVVTDDKGRHVHGLKQSDFAVEEDGNPETIRSFKESGLTTARAQPKLSPGMYSNAQAAPTTGPVNIILIDSLNSPPQLVAIAQQQIVSYLKSMPEGNQVAIFSLSFNGLHALQGFTSDRNLLLRAMNINFYALAPNGQTINRPWATIDALDEIGAYVSAIKGRKNLLWFAPGVPVMLTRDGGYQWNITDGLKITSPDMAIVHRLMDTYELFTAEQIAVSPVDIRGVVKIGMPAMRMDAVAEDTGGVVYAESNDLSAELRQAIDDGSHYYTLSYLTPHHLSAGHYHKIKITANRPGLHLVYRTGYNDEPPPQPKTPVGPKLIQAAMQGEAPPATQLLFNLRISPIPGAPPVVSTIPDPFADTDPFAFSNSFTHPLPSTNDASDQSASPDQPVAQPPAAQPADESAPPASQPGRRTLSISGQVTRYTFIYAVPQSQIAFTTNPDGTRTGALEFDIGAYDPAGRPINSISQTMQMPLTADEYAEFIKTPFQFSQQLDLPPGPATLRIGILDPTSNKVGTLELLIAVPKTTPVAEKASR